MPDFNSPPVQALFFLLFGAALLLMARWQHRHQQRLEREGEVVRGIVFRLERDRHLYFPVVRFLTRKQEWITARYHIGTQPASFAEGEEVEIRYHPADPRDFTIGGADSGVGLWLLVLLGLGLMGYAVVHYFSF